MKTNTMWVTAMLIMMLLALGLGCFIGNAFLGLISLLIGFLIGFFWWRKYSKILIKSQPAALVKPIQRSVK